ncbi:hypothetical protein TNIN_220161 [Trichonephila inaurata madagascariensis]|uniref:Uncharacterized protein n=1 Tax=Trichonephila inaurata madagascariensis TaxID=2747483 RepID=A0A8X6XWR2_9ARAC|nr:hypothetical protein TNIN_220161 [Trichonephila inaurata madagascariensis]
MDHLWAKKKKWASFSEGGVLSSCNVRVMRNAGQGRRRNIRYWSRVIYTRGVDHLEKNRYLLKLEVEENNLIHFFLEDFRILDEHQ